MWEGSERGGCHAAKGLGLESNLQLLWQGHCLWAWGAHSTHWATGSPTFDIINYVWTETRVINPTISNWKISMTTKKLHSLRRLKALGTFSVSGSCAKIFLSTDTIYFQTHILIFCADNWTETLLLASKTLKCSGLYYSSTDKEYSIRTFFLKQIHQFDKLHSWCISFGHCCIISYV